MEPSNNANGKLPEDFNVLSFERKLVELVEELRLRRNLEVESEKSLKSAMDEKYQEELNWEEQMRRHSREKEDLEQQIDLLKRKLEDKVCVSDENKAKQQVMNKTYSHEIRMLKETLRASMSEKLNLQQKVQELEGKLKLHDHFQESTLSQVSEARKMMKSIMEENQELITAQKNVMENVASAKLMFRKYDLCNQHLEQSMKIIDKKSEALKKELISSRSEIVLLKQNAIKGKQKTDNATEIDKLQNKVLNLENLLLSSRKENEKTLNNFVESNKLLCKFMDKYSETQERENKLFKEFELIQEKLRKTQNELEKTKAELKKIEEETALKEKERIENLSSTEMQTEPIFNNCCSCSKNVVKTSDDKITATIASLMPKAMDTDFLAEIKNGLLGLQQNALMMQSEMSISNGIQSISVDQLCVNSADKKITLSQVLKRKLEVMNSGAEIELISMKKRFTEKNNQLAILTDEVVDGNIQNEMLTYPESSDQLLSKSLNADIAEDLTSANFPVDHKYLIFNTFSGNKDDDKIETKENFC